MAMSLLVLTTSSRATHGVRIEERHGRYVPTLFDHPRLLLRRLQLAPLHAPAHHPRTRSGSHDKGHQPRDVRLRQDRLEGVEGEYLSHLTETQTFLNPVTPVCRLTIQKHSVAGFLICRTSSSSLDVSCVDALESSSWSSKKSFH